MPQLMGSSSVALWNNVVVICSGISRRVAVSKVLVDIIVIQW
jgi:hypothetical protein